MSILDKYVDFVKGQLTFHQERAEQFKDNSYKHSKHLETAARFAALLDDLQIVGKQLDNRPESSPSIETPQKPKLYLTPEDIEGLPQTVMDELSISSSDQIEFAIATMLKEAPHGVLSLDQIIVKLYRATKEVHKRQTVTSRLYRMAQRNLVFNVPGKKGVYSVRQLMPGEIDRLFGEGAVTDSEE